MSTGSQTLRGLAEEAKKRIVLLLICVFGLSYLMSLTSSSVWINFPFAAVLILFSRYISLEFDIRRKNTLQNKETVLDQSAIQRKSSVELHTFPFKLEKSKSDWRKKVNSPPVESAIEQFTRHLVSEWITDLWYSRITPDRDGPNELVGLINGVLGEIASRARDVNLINLLTRDIINLICNHLEVYRLCQSKIGKDKLVNLPFDRRDSELRLVLEAEKKLHPALISVSAEHKVLQQLANGLISFALRPEELSCSFFHYIARELIACTVLRPVINLANPRFINERIENLAINLANRAALKKVTTKETASGAPPMPSSDELYSLMDKSSPGLELVQFRHEKSETLPAQQILKNTEPAPSAKNPNDTTLSSDSQNNGRSKSTGQESTGGEWAQALDLMSKHKNQTLAPEHFENMWTKGRNYRKKENQNMSTNQDSPPVKITNNNAIQHHTHKNIHIITTTNTTSTRTTYQDRKESKGNIAPEESDSSDVSEEDENENESSNIMGLDSPGTHVWESKGKGNLIVTSSHIRHPLEPSDLRTTKRGKNKGHNRKVGTVKQTSFGRKRSRSSDVWQEVERTSFLVGDGQDLLNKSNDDASLDEFSDEGEMESLGFGRVFSGTEASSSLSSVSSVSVPESSYSATYTTNNVLADSFIKLRCEVLGANIVKSGSGMFAVYSVAVTDANGNSWSIKRRFRHFEELHRRLKEFAEYNLSLPPKHFLSSGLEVPVVRERCKLLDTYLKKLLQISTVSGSIEVWDFLSVDSQTYMFSDSLSIIQTLSVNLEEKPHEKVSNGQLSPIIQNPSTSKEITQTNKTHHESGDNLRLRKGTYTKKELPNNNYQENSGGDLDKIVQTDFSLSIKSDKSKKSVSDGIESAKESLQIDESGGDPITPNEWTPPNLSIPILNLVDVVFQLQGGGWIRRQAFWVAKQLLQLGMGDAFDDWIVEKIQLLRTGPVIASAIHRVEQILWPDGIFLTKHPKRRTATAAPSPNNQSNSTNHAQNVLTPEQQIEAARRANFVRELIIEKAPAALVSLVGRKEYERCALDIYFFLQSPVCLKQLAFELLELLILAAFPELDNVVRKYHEEY